MSARPDPVRDQRRRRCAPVLAEARANGDRQVALFNALHALSDASAMPWGCVSDVTAARLRAQAMRALTSRDDEDLDTATAAIREALAQVGAA